MKTCYISRLGGCGDVLHSAHLPRLIKKHFGVDSVTFETNYHGMHILSGNPYIDTLEYVDVNKMTYNRMSKNLEWAKYQYDIVFDLANTIEKAYCLNENDWRYYTNEQWRRDQFGKKSYYDVMVDAVGLPKECYGERAQLYYSDKEHTDCAEWARKKKDIYSHIFLINMSGSTLHKKFIQAKSISHKLLDSYKKCLVILTGDEHCKDDVFEHERVISYVGSDVNGFRSVALKCKYVDLTISLESGLPLVAHSWDAPCLHLLTAASPENHCMYAKNAHWIQSDTKCSPCHRNPREYYGCPIVESHPACIWFNEDKIMDKVKGIL